MLYDLEDKGMLAASNGGYIYINKLYSTIGIIGYTEAAQFLGLEISNNNEYKEFLQLILGTIKDSIEKGMKQFIWGVNQPAGNRSYNSPFTNVSWYDKYYFESLFGEFSYPDGSKPKWCQIDTLQSMFMELMR